MATRKPKPSTLEVDAAMLTVALQAIATNVAPATVPPSAAFAMIKLDAALADHDDTTGILDLGWGMRAVDAP